MTLKYCTASWLCAQGICNEIVLLIFLFYIAASSSNFFLQADTRFIIKMSFQAMMKEKIPDQFPWQHDDITAFWPQHAMLFFQYIFLYLQKWSGLLQLLIANCPAWHISNANWRLHNSCWNDSHIQKNINLYLIF